MKRKNRIVNSILVFSLVVLVTVLAFASKLNANAQNTCYSGVKIGGIDISGMTLEEAQNAVNAYVSTMAGTEVTFEVAGGNKVVTTYGALGVYWANPEVLTGAFAAQRSGNVVERYKEKKDIEVNGLNLELNIAFDNTMVESFINSECKKYDQALANASIRRENGEFIIEGGEGGESISLSGSMIEISENLYGYYLQGQTEVKLPVIESDAQATYDQLSMIKDVLGTYTTSFSSSGANRANNVINGCSKLNGLVVFPGEEVSAYQMISPFTEANGYYLAGSYANGQVVESFGGGICQVTSTLYNAVLLSELEVTERNNHSMVVTYVPKSADAAIAESSGKDFKFRNNTEYPIFIEGVTQDKKITFTIYGVETRPENRRIEYVSEVLSQTDPGETMVADSSLPIGKYVTESAHIGYTARLWKVVYVDDVEVSREIVNDSRYNPSPKTVRVGVATDNADYYNRMMSVIATGDLGSVQYMASQILLVQSQNAVDPAQTPSP